MHILRVPITLPEGRYSLNLGKQVKTADGLVLQIDRHKTGLALEVSGLPSLDAAQALYDQLEDGLIRGLLLTGIPVSSTPGFSTPTEAPTKPGTGVYDASLATAYPATGEFRGMSMSATITEIFQDYQVLEPLRDWLEDKAGKTPPADKKFRLAVSLYREHFSEESMNAKFLTLFLALESMFVSEPKPDKVTEMMARWKDEAKREYKTESDPEIRAAYDALLSELGFRRGSSLKSQLRSLIRRALHGTDEAEIEKVSKRASELYDLRSKLVHDGEMPGGAGSVLHEVRNLVRRVLRGLSKIPT